MQGTFQSFLLFFLQKKKKKSTSWWSLYYTPKGCLISYTKMLGGIFVFCLPSQKQAHKQVRDEANCGKFSEQYPWLSHGQRNGPVSKPIFLEAWGYVESSSRSLYFCINHHKELKINKLMSNCPIHLERPSVVEVTGTFLADAEPPQASTENSGRCNWGCTGGSWLQKFGLRVCTALSSKPAASASFK